MDKQKHKLYMAQILSQIFKDKGLPTSCVRWARDFLQETSLTCGSL